MPFLCTYKDTFIGSCAICLTAQSCKIFEATHKDSVERKIDMKQQQNALLVQAVMHREENYHFHQPIEFFGCT